MALYHTRKDGTMGVCRAAAGNCPLGSPDTHIQAANEYDANMKNMEILKNQLENLTSFVKRKLAFWEDDDFETLTPPEQFAIIKEFGDPEKVDEDVVSYYHFRQQYDAVLSRYSDYLNTEMPLRELHDLAKTAETEVEAYALLLKDDDVMTSADYRRIGGLDLFLDQKFVTAFKKSTYFDSAQRDLNEEPFAEISNKIIDKKLTPLEKVSYYSSKDTLVYRTLLKESPAWEVKSYLEHEIETKSVDNAVRLMENIDATPQGFKDEMARGILFFKMPLKAQKEYINTVDQKYLGTIYGAKALTPELRSLINKKIPQEYRNPLLDVKWANGK